jgi:uncharacterized protein YerC
MNTDIKRLRFTAPNGERIQRSLHERLLVVKPILEQANEERITRSDAASRIVIQGVAVSEATAYTYVRLLGIQWHHRQDYRPRHDRKKLRRLVTPLLAKGLTFYAIAAQVGCSISTVARFVREAGLIEDGRRYVAATAKYGRRKKEAVK